MLFVKLFAWEQRIIFNEKKWLRDTEIIGEHNAKMRLSEV